MPIYPFGIVLETKYQTSQHLGIHLGKAYRPYLPNLLTRGSRESTTFPHLEGRFQGDGKCPTWVMLTDIRLVYPSACQVQTGRYSSSHGGVLDPCILFSLAQGSLEGGRTACRESFCRCALQLDVFYTPLCADTPLLLTAPFGIDDKDVRLDKVERGQEINDATTFVDIGILDIAYGLHHEKTFFLREHGFAVLVLLVGSIRTNAHIEVAILGSLFEELHVSRVEQVVTSADENFLSHAAVCLFVCLGYFTIPFSRYSARFMRTLEAASSA